MKIITKVFIGLLLLQSGWVLGQGFLYVTAENGLIVRAQADRNAQRIFKLDYATEVQLWNTTGITFSIVDDGVTITGEWVEIISYNDEGEEIRGFVFDGYLTREPMSKPLVFKYDGMTLEFDDTFMRYYESNAIKTDTVYLEMDLEHNFFKVPFRIKQQGYDTVSVYQQFNRSVTVYNEGPHCDMIDWKNFKTDWIKVPYDTSKEENLTLDHSYTERNTVSFVKEEIDRAIQQHCTEDWYELVKDIPDPAQYPMGVATHQIIFKVVLSNAEETLEKVVLIDVPMGC